MPLETATYVNQLDASDPADTDNVAQGSAHLRLIKATLLATFPNMGAAVSATAGAIDGLVNNLITGGAIQLQGANGNTNNGSVPVGSIHAFPADPGSTLCGRNGSGTGTEQFLRCDGSTYASATYPTLAASPFVTVAGSNFTVPQMMDTGRFLRSYTFAGATEPGQTQSNQNALHAHTLTDPGHTHTTSDPGHTHGVNFSDPGHNHQTGVGNSASNGGAFATSVGGGQNNAIIENNTTGISVSNQSNTTGITNQNNTTGITMANQGGSECRPEAFVVFYCIKT